MKRVVVILFSAVLVYGGVAWALGRCLVHANDHEHSLEEHHPSGHGSTILSDSHASFSPVIHCPTAELRIGPVAQSGSARLKQTQKVSGNHLPWFYEPAQTGLGHSRWLDAVFRPLSVFSQSGGAVGRHLLFSILQI